jgi:hypothetical protein
MITTDDQIRQGRPLKGLETSETRRAQQEVQLGDDYNDIQQSMTAQKSLFILRCIFLKNSWPNSSELVDQIQS